MRVDIAPGGTFPDYELTDHAKAGAGSAAAMDRPGGPRALARRQDPAARANPDQARSEPRGSEILALMRRR